MSLLRCLPIARAGCGHGWCRKERAMHVHGYVAALWGSGTLGRECKATGQGVACFLSKHSQPQAACAQGVDGH
eukprot:1439726-Pyramimonas_sp.AAC.1